MVVDAGGGMAVAVAVGRILVVLGATREEAVEAGEVKVVVFVAPVVGALATVLTKVGVVAVKVVVASVVVTGAVVGGANVVEVVAGNDTFTNSPVATTVLM